MLRRPIIFGLAVMVAFIPGINPLSIAQQPTQTPQRPPTVVPSRPAPEQPQQAPPTPRVNGQAVTAEQVAALVVYFYSPRVPLAQIRRTGVERGRITRPTDNGGTEEVTFERRFIRGESSDKDKIRLDQRIASSGYSLVYGDGRVWGILNDTVFTPRQDTVADFLMQNRQDVEALLRYRENGSTLTFVRQDRQQGIDLIVLDLADRSGQRTRYYISSRTWRIIALEYEATAPGATTAVRYRRTFHDYRYAQNTLVPFRSVLYADGRQVQEMRLLTVTYGLRLEDTLFQDPNAPATTTSATP